MQTSTRVTGGYFFVNFAYEIRFMGYTSQIFFYGIDLHGVQLHFYRAIKFLSTDCTVVRKHEKASIDKRKM
jgi:hypothetical protein